jgi:hypothetical protein
MVDTAEFARIVSERPPEEGGREVTAEWIRKLCQRRLIEGAVKEPKGRQEWKIPSDARMPGVHLETRGYHGNDGYSPSEFAERCGVSRSLVHHWIRTGKLKPEWTTFGYKIPKQTRDPRKTKAGAPQKGGRPRKRVKGPA